MKVTIGSCSQCGGAVTVPCTTWAITPPTPSCESCGSVPKGKLPVIETERRRAPVVQQLWWGTITHHAGGAA